MLAYPMQIVGVIPARYGSRRFPGKPLAMIGSKPLLQWVIEGAKQSQKINKIIVATDDDRICQLVETLGEQCVMTSSDLPTGSDRVWSAVKDMNADVVVNIQGDEPLIDGPTLDALVEPFFTNEHLEMATLAKPISVSDLENKNTAKILLNKNSEAIYFSRFPIPYSRDTIGEEQDICCVKHIGIYAYQKGFLKQFCAQPPVAIEAGESLEQLRALYLGAKIKVIQVNHESWGVDHPEDIERVKKKLKDRYGSI